MGEQLYDFYGDKYYFTDLQKNIDSGLNDYISTLRYGDKYNDQIRKAVYDLMSGIGDGTITYSNGKFADSKGRYFNDQNKKKDVYGWAANYIYSNMGNSNKYIPEKKKQFSTGEASKALIRGIFNTDTPNYASFLDLDRSDTTKITNRAKIIANWIDSNLNSFNDYEGDKDTWIKYAKEASDKLKNGSLDNGDLFALSRAFPEIQWNKMFATTAIQKQENPQNREAFANYVNREFPREDNDNVTYAANYNIKYGANTEGRIVNYLDSLDDKDQYAYLLAAIENPEYDFGKTSGLIQAVGGAVSIPSQYVARRIIQNLKNKNKLIQDQDNSNIYYIPGLNDRKTGYYYDASTKTIYKKNLRDIPYYQKKIYNKYSGKSDEDSWIDQLFVKYEKQGGVLKAYSGTSLWYSNIKPFDQNNYKASYNTDVLIDPDIFDNNWNPWVSNIVGNGKGRYKPTKGITREQVTNIENTPYYQNFTKALLDENGYFTELGKKWALAVDKLRPKGSLATFFDEKGSQRKSWEAQNNDVYDRPPQKFTKLADYVNYVRNDQIAGAAHNVFRNEGIRYFYKDVDGEKHWVDPTEIEKYVISKDPTESGWNDDKTIFWKDYEITGLKGENNSQTLPEQKKTQPEDPSQVNTTFMGKNNKGNSNLKYFIPDILDAGRLFSSLWTNRDVYNTINKSLTPVFKDTYERYSPITGAFNQRQLTTMQGLDEYRRVNRAFTSDPTLWLAAMKEARRQAADLEYKGLLADDAEIKRTKGEALARIEDNMARRMDVANFNRASINQTLREKAQLLASRKGKDWQSIDNFAKDFISRLRTKYDTDKEKYDQFRLQTAIDDIDNRYQDIARKAQQKLIAWQSDPANAGKLITSMPDYDKYVENMNKLDRWKKAQYNKAIADISNYKYDNPYLNQSPYSFTFRNGGVINHNILNKVNRILKNEDNS